MVMACPRRQPAVHAALREAHAWTINNGKNGGGLLGYNFCRRPVNGIGPDAAGDAEKLARSAPPSRWAPATTSNYNTTFKVEYRIDRANLPALADVKDGSITQDRTSCSAPRCWSLLTSSPAAAAAGVPSTRLRCGPRGLRGVASSALPTGLQRTSPHLTGTPPHRRCASTAAPSSAASVSPLPAARPSPRPRRSTAACSANDRPRPQRRRRRREWLWRAPPSPTRWDGKHAGGAQEMFQCFAEKILAASDELAPFETPDTGVDQYSLASTWLLDVARTIRRYAEAWPTRSTTRSRRPGVGAGADHGSRWA